MKTYINFLLALGLVLLIINIILGIAGQTEFGIYFAVDAIAFILLVLIFDLDSWATVKLRQMGTIFFIGFLIILFFKIYQMV